jgi:predicted HTH domain antitoxin
MESIQTVRKTDLARNSRRIIQKVLRGQIAVVESHGQPEVAIVDIIDYRLQRAALHFYARSQELLTAEGLSDQLSAQTADEQDRYNLVLSHYLGEAISLGRAAELLDLPWVDLRMRLARLGIPLRLGPATLEEAYQDVRNAITMSNEIRS